MVSTAITALKKVAYLVTADWHSKGLIIVPDCSDKFKYPTDNRGMLMFLICKETDNQKKVLATSIEVFYLRFFEYMDGIHVVLHGVDDD